jgi:hypothetical protein
MLSRRTHKWIVLIVGVQALIWTLSGVYMTSVHIDIIHGDHFISTAEPKPLDPSEIVSPVSAAAAVLASQTVRLAWLLDRPVYIVASDGGERLLDARTGQPLPPPSREQVRQLADYWFTGEEQLADLSLIHSIPGEVRGREPPLWRAEFGGWNKPTLYFSPQTGQLLTRRHELWRVFDFVWMLHIMDYDERENVNNWLLRAFTWLAVFTALSGAWLLWFAFPRRRRKARPQ